MSFGQIMLCVLIAIPILAFLWACFCVIYFRARKNYIGDMFQEFAKAFDGLANEWLAKANDLLNKAREG